jgi:hypothetical protein
VGWDSPLGTAVTSGLLYQPQMIDEGDCGEIGGMKIGRGNRSTRRKPAPALGYKLIENNVRENVHCYSSICLEGLRKATETYIRISVRRMKIWTEDFSRGTHWTTTLRNCNAVWWSWARSWKGFGKEAILTSLKDTNPPFSRRFVSFNNGCSLAKNKIIASKRTKFVKELYRLCKGAADPSSHVTVIMKPSSKRVPSRDSIHLIQYSDRR